MRAATLLLVAVVTLVGLWGATHSEELGITASAAESAPASAQTVGEHFVTTAAVTAMDEDMVIGVVTCILGILCGMALAVLLSLALRFRLVRFQRQRPVPAPIRCSPAFGHCGRQRFGLLELNLLRI
ncbi:hypothetical protein D1J51_13150 [Leucobacter sp. wl10]|nr:hypothetical protein D1J51_13150 [Leucobacter sp. wl10]